MQPSLFAVAALLLSIFTFVYPGLSGTAQASKIGVAVENIRFENNARVAFVRLANQSTKNITAFNMTVDLVFQDGRTDHYEHAIDLIGQVISFGSGGIQPGNRYEMRMDFAESVSTVNAKPDVVVYADLTADVNQNSDALNRITGERRNSAQAANKAAEIINEVAASSVTPDPYGMALTQLKLLADKERNSPDLSASELALIIADLQNMVRFPRKDVSPRAALREYASGKTKDAEIKSAHSLVRKAQ